MIETRKMKHRRKATEYVPATTIRIYIWIKRWLTAPKSITKRNKWSMHRWTWQIDSLLVDAEHTISRFLMNFLIFFLVFLFCLCYLGEYKGNQRRIKSYNERHFILFCKSFFKRFKGLAPNHRDFFGEFLFHSSFFSFFFFKS